MKKLTLLLLAILAFANTQAQNLPNKQKKSVKIPADFKIDGKSTEWNNKFQAYNIATNLYYTIANNTEFVYLIAHIQDPAVINRIANNGFTFELYKNETPQKKDLISITLPYSGSKYFSLNLTKPTGADTLLEKGILKANNALLQKFHKFTIVKGIEGLDSVSVYNDEAGIRFAEGLDINEDYTIELQLPVKFIQLLPGDNLKFKYHLVINGLPAFGPIVGSTMLSSDGTTTYTAAKDFTPEQQAANEELQARIAAKYAATDFKAEYTLAK